MWEVEKNASARKIHKGLRKLQDARNSIMIFEKGNLKKKLGNVPLPTALLQLNLCSAQEQERLRGAAGLCRGRAQEMICPEQWDVPGVAAGTKKLSSELEQHIKVTQ